MLAQTAKAFKFLNLLMFLVIILVHFKSEKRARGLDIRAIACKTLHFFLAQLFLARFDRPIHCNHSNCLKAQVL